MLGFGKLGDRHRPCSFPASSGDYLASVLRKGNLQLSEQIKCEDLPHSQHLWDSGF